MSAMSLVPTLLWRYLSRRSGIDVSELMVSAAAGQQAGYAELRGRTVRYVVNQVRDYVHEFKDFHPTVGESSERKTD